MKIGNLLKGSAERLSKSAFYVIIGLIALLFVLFFFVGYNRPFEDEPIFNAPLFTDAVIVFMLLLTVVAICVMSWSIWRNIKTRGKDQRIENNIQIKRNAYVVALGTALALALTFLLGSSSLLRINGKEYADGFWLKTADMFIFTTALLLMVAIGAVVYGMIKNRR